jgi:hypothetical protein
LLLIFRSEIFVIDNLRGIAKRARGFLLHNCGVCSFPTPGTLGFFKADFGVLFVVINVRPIYFWFAQFSTNEALFMKTNQILLIL